MTPPEELPAAFAHLPRDNNLAVDQALAEVLPGLGQASRAAAVDLLLSRSHTPTLMKLIGQWDSFDAGLRNLLAERLSGLLEAIRGALRDADLQARCGAIALIAHSRSGEMAYALADALSGSCPQTRRRAAQGLRELGEHYVGSPSSGAAEPMRPGSRQAYLETLGHTIMGWERHESLEVLEACLWFTEDLTPIVLQKLAQPGTTIAKALKQILTKASSPRLAGFTMKALGIPPLRDTAAGAIRATSHSSFRRAILTRAVHQDLTAIRAGCRRVGNPDAWFDEVIGLGEVACKPARRIVELLVAFGADAREGVSVARRLIDCGQPSIAQAAFAHLLNRNNAHSTVALESLACRLGDSLGAIAVRELERRHPEVSAIAATSGFALAQDASLAPRRALEQYWRDYDELAPDDLEQLARSMRPFASYLVPALGMRLAALQPYQVARALRTAGWLKLTNELAESIYRLCLHPSAAVRGCAVRTLGGLPGATSVRIVRRAFDDPDERVQANAIEAMVELNPEEAAALALPKLRSASVRVRGTAISSLLRSGHTQAGVALIDMLESSDSREKRTALWVVDTLGLTAATKRVQAIGGTATDPRIQKTANALVRKLGGHAGVPDVGIRELDHLGVGEYSP